MNFKNEKQLLIGIKYTLPSLVLLFSLIVTVFLYVKNKTDFEHIKENTEKVFIDHQKKLIKEQINNIYDYIIQEQLQMIGNILGNGQSGLNHLSVSLIENVYNFQLLRYGTN